MSDQKPTEPTESEASDEKETETEAESETEAEAEAEAAPSSSKDAPREKRSGKSRKRRERERAAAAAAAKKAPGNSILFAVAGLAAGAAVGWFGHIASAKAKLKADIAPVPAASGSAGAPAPSVTGPCATLEKEVCAKTGDTSAACGQAKSASGLLTSGTCEAALETVPAMVEKVKAARAVCDQLVARLCKDLTPVSGACAMVKERTPSFPTERCAELSKNYDQVLTELKQMEEQGVIPGTPGVQVQRPGGPGGPGGPPGGMPPGHAPGDGHGH
jgi:hypothetical protein